MTLPDGFDSRKKSTKEELDTKIDELEKKLGELSNKIKPIPHHEQEPKKILETSGTLPKGFGRISDQKPIKEKKIDWSLSGNIVKQGIIVGWIIFVAGLLEGIFDIFSLGDTAKIGAATIICSVSGGITFAIQNKRSMVKRGTLPR